jgi:hypothetical protein
MAGEVRNLFHRFVRRHSESRDHTEAISCVAIDSNDGERDLETLRVCVCVRACVRMKYYSVDEKGILNRSVSLDGESLVGN